MINSFKIQGSFPYSRQINFGILSLFIMLMLTSFGHAQTQDSMQASDSSIEFKIKSFGIQVEGSFANADISAFIDNQSLVQSYIKARIPVESISTGISKRDKHLMEDKYFDAEEHAFIEFESKEIRQKDEASYLARGNLMIKGIERSIEILFQIQEKDGVEILTSYFELNRLDYQVGGKNWTMGDIVKIAVSYSFKN